MTDERMTIGLGSSQNCVKCGHNNYARELLAMKRTKYVPEFMRTRVKRQTKRVPMI